MLADKKLPKAGSIYRSRGAWSREKDGGKGGDAQ